MTEQELQAKIDEAKTLRAEKCKAKIDEILKEFNCIITTEINVVVNGKIVNPAIQAL